MISKEAGTGKPQVLCDLCPATFEKLGSMDSAYEVEVAHLITRHDGWKVWPEHPIAKEQKRKLGLPLQDPNAPKQRKGGLTGFMERLTATIDEAMGVKRR